MADILDEPLHPSDARVRMIWETASDAMVLSDAAGIVVDANPAYYRLYGYPPEAVLGHCFALIFPPEMRAEARAAYHATFQDPLITPLIESAIRRADGTERWVETRYDFVTEYGRRTAMLSTIRDVTERKRADSALREHLRLSELDRAITTALSHTASLPDILQRCAQALVDHLDAAFARIWTLNDSAALLELQASAGQYTHLTGAHARVPLGSLKIGRIAQERVPHLTNTVMGDPEVSEQEWAHREGLVAFAGYPLLVEDRVVGVMALFARQPLSETTLYAMQSAAAVLALGIERKQTEAALTESEERFRSLAAHAPVMIWQATAQGACVYVNQTWCTFTGLAETESLGQGWATALHPDDWAHVGAAWTQAVSTGQPYQLEVRLRHADGFFRDVIMAGQSFADHTGQFAGYIGTLTDITAQRETERQKEAFIAMVAHELKTPLTTIKGLTQIAIRRLEQRRAIRGSGPVGPGREPGQPADGPGQRVGRCEPHRAAAAGYCAGPLRFCGPRPPGGCRAAIDHGGASHSG